MPRRPDPRASPGDQPSRGGAHSTHRDVITLPAHAWIAFRLVWLALYNLYQWQDSVPLNVE